MKKGLLRRKGRLNLLLRVLLMSLVTSLFLSPASAYALGANTLGDYGNVTVMEYDGGFDSLQTDGTPNALNGCAIIIV